MKFGKYQIEKELGKGAMGVVYLAYDPVIERRVAIKTMNPQLFEDLEQRERFFREAKSAGNLQHPNIVIIYDMGIEGDSPYIVMEYVEGEDLSSLIKKKAISTENALKIMSQLCDALAYAHSKGIIHRDIKPANIRVLPDYSIKIMDFGIAKKTGSDLTQTGILLGTVSYMAPEQLKEGKVSPQSDQFSAGVVFYEMLTGKKCFEGDNITSVMYKIVSFSGRELDLKAIPSDIASILTRMLAPLPEKRFASCADVSNLIENILVPATVPVKRQKPTEKISTPPPLPTEQKTVITSKPKPVAKKKKTSVLGILIFLAIALTVATGGYLYFTQKRKSLITQKSIEKMRETPLAERNGKLTKEEADNLKSDNRGIVEGEKTGVLPKKSIETEIAKPQNKPFIPKKKRLPRKKPPLKTAKKTTAVASRKTERGTVGKAPEAVSEKEVFSYSKEVKKRERLMNFIEAQKEMFDNFKRKASRMSPATKVAESNRLFNAGMQALGNGSNRLAAVNFWKSIMLNPSRKEAYSFLCVALARMRAYDDIKKVLRHANQRGFSLSQLKENRLFANMYDRLAAQGLL